MLEELDEYDVYPVRLADEHKVLHKVLTWVFRFDDILDADKLHDALCRLFRHEGWRKCGGRYAYTKNGKLEIRVPKTFTRDTPAVNFSNQTSCLNMDDHSIARDIPRQTDSPSVQDLPPDIRLLAGGSSTALTVADLIKQGLPQVSLHITTFHNGTLVFLSWPHTLMDAAGQTALLQNWSHVLAGREDLIIPAESNQDEDVLDTILTSYEKPFEKPVIASKQASLLWQIIFFLLYMWKTYRAQPVKKIVYLPRPALEHLLTNARTHLQKGSFLTENDILTAWLARLYAISYDTPRSCTALQIYNLRPKLLPDTKGVHLQNIHTTLPTFFSRYICSESLTATALLHRQQLAEQTTTDELMIALRSQQVERPKLPRYLTAESLNSLLLPINNLVKCDFHSIIDFSPAVVSCKDEKRRGKLVSWYNRPLAPEGKITMSQAMPLGRDLDGGMYILAAFPEKTWSVVAKELETLAKAQQASRQTTA